ncbi:MAG: prepilin-type N-terminal cleavage/methylation domain-containing protein [Gammaproteobacteria bacterium]|nr:prepilin-type N-terminal cleavage/methylation domain-containing protein [Gammaproteobacteria bacterium]
MKGTLINGKQRGVTLMELLIVVAIISIIASVAYPSYTNFVVRSKRTAATGALLQIADRQQQFFMDNKRYAGSMTSLGYASDSIMIDEEGAVVTTADDGRVYNIQISASNIVTYELTATPQLKQAEKDTECGNLTLTHTGAKGQSGSGNNCW